MTLSRADSEALERREALSPAEKDLIDDVFRDLRTRAKRAGVRLIGDDRAAALEAALVRYIEQSRTGGENFAFPATPPPVLWQVISGLQEDTVYSGIDSAEARRIYAITEDMCKAAPKSCAVRLQTVLQQEPRTVDVLKQWPAP